MIAQQQRGSEIPNGYLYRSSYSNIILTVLFQSRLVGSFFYMISPPALHKNTGFPSILSIYVSLCYSVFPIGLNAFFKAIAVVFIERS
jgi:hypothetical protein